MRFIEQLIIIVFACVLFVSCVVDAEASDFTDNTSYEWIAHAANVADIVSTKMFLNEGVEEGNTMYGKRPTDKRLLSILLLKTLVVRGVNHYSNNARGFNLGWAATTGLVVGWNMSVTF